MSILVDASTRVLVQGITGREGQFHTGQMLSYGTNIVAGVTPGKGGTRVEGVPVFDTVEEALEAEEPNAAVIYVPAAFAPDAMAENIDAGIPLVVCITEGIPVLDTMHIYHYAREHRVTLIGPNCPGVISPGKCKLGIMPGHIHTPGRVGVVSRSGTLTYEVVQALTDRGIGQSTCIGIGGDPIIGTSFTEVLAMFQADNETDMVVLIGEIGGSDEELAADYIRTMVSKPVVAFIAGKTAPADKRMGHAGAIISSGKGTAAEKISALQMAGVKVANSPAEIPSLIAAL
ncbi:MAG: succinate--CoA ligase subunit alpha [Chloroflexi bacterium]|nr:succinate--CoA ligase subunit alpha [Chloroflexota bacterium]